MLTYWRNEAKGRKVRIPDLVVAVCRLILNEWQRTTGSQVVPNILAHSYNYATEAKLFDAGINLHERCPTPEPQAGCASNCYAVLEEVCRVLDELACYFSSRYVALP